MIRAALLTTLLVLSACSVISAEAKKEVQDQSAIGQARLKKWDDLSAPQKKQAYREGVQGYVDLDFSFFGTPVPDGFAAVKSAAK